MTTARHLQDALGALRQKPANLRAAMDALEKTQAVAQGQPEDPVAGVRASAANWARRAILRGGPSLSPVIRGIEAALARKVVVPAPRQRTIRA